MANVKRVPGDHPGSGWCGLARPLFHLSTLLVGDVYRCFSVMSCIAEKTAPNYFIFFRPTGARTLMTDQTDYTDIH